MLGSPNPGQSFGRGGAFRSGSNGGVGVPVGKLGATEIDLPIVILIFESLILAPRMRVTVVMFVFPDPCASGILFSLRFAERIGVRREHEDRRV